VREDGGPGLRVVVRLASALQPHAAGAPRVHLDLPAPVTVGAVLDALAVAHPGIGRRIRDEAGAVRRHVNVFVGPYNTRDLDDVDTVVPDGAEVALIPAVSGG
jgi:sulfur-carrier protein